MHLLHAVFWSIVTFLAVPIVIWLVLTILVPTITSASDKTGVKTDRYVAHLASVRLAEARYAALFNYNFGLTEDAWPYRFGDRLARRFAPEEDGSEFVDSKRGQQLEREGRGQHFDNKGNQSEKDPEKALTGYLSSWLDDRFYVIQSRLIGFGVPRAIYALYMYVVFMPAIAAAWFIGRYSARLRKRANLSPMQVRHRGYQWLAFACLVLLPTLCLIPYPFPAPLVMFVVCAVGCVAFALASRHFVEI